jgi:hypothetical protein
MVVLAMLNIGKDYILLRDQLRELKETVVSKTNRLVAKIDSVID